MIFFIIFFTSVSPVPRQMINTENMVEVYQPKISTDDEELNDLIYHDPINTKKNICFIRKSNAIRTVSTHVNNCFVIGLMFIVIHSINPV
jgi:hypothetical protein